MNVITRTPDEPFILDIFKNRDDTSVNFIKFVNGLLYHTADKYPSIDYYFKPNPHSVALVQVSTVAATTHNLSKLEETSKKYRHFIEGEILFIYINPQVDDENQFHQYAKKFFSIGPYKTRSNIPTTVPVPKVKL